MNKHCALVVQVTEYLKTKSPLVSYCRMKSNRIVHWATEKKEISTNSCYFINPVLIKSRKNLSTQKVYCHMLKGLYTCINEACRDISLETLIGHTYRAYLEEDHGAMAPLKQ